jgi:hypothetical protein
MCQSAGRKCVYANTAKRRGLQSGYVRGLETLLGLVVRYHPDTQAQIEKLLRRQETKDCLLGGHDSETCIQLWRASASFRRINSVIQQQSCDLEDESPPPEDDAVDFSALRPSGGSEIEANDTGTCFRQSNPIPTSHTNSTCEPTTENSGTTARDMFDLFKQPFPPHTIELMEDYFAYTHSWFPILERQKLLRVMHSQPGSMAHDRQVTDMGYRMSLWALIAYTVAARPQLSQRHAMLNPQNLEISIRARALIDDDDFSIGHVQAVLILVLLRLKLGHVHAAWVLVAQAVRMIDLLDHRPHLKRYRQVFQGCIILDNFVSTLLRRPPYLSDDQLTNHDVLNIEDEEEDESLEEWDVWTVPPQSAAHSKEEVPSRGPLRALSTFKFIFEVMCYSSKFSSDETRDQEIINSDLEYLQNWRLNLPAYCQWTDSPESLKPPILVLHLSFNFVISTLLSKSCNMDIASVALCAETAKLSTILLEKYTRVTGNAWVPPLFLGFATQARKLIDLSMSTSSYQTSTNLSESLRKIIDNTSCSGDFEDRVVHWKGLPLATSAVTAHDHSYKSSTYHMQPVEELEIYSDMMGSADLVDHTDMSREVPFEAICEQIAASYPLDRYV